MLTVILTGGSSRRMGRDKALLPFRGSTLLQTLIDRYAACGTVGVSVDRAERFLFQNALELVDEYPGQGPMNGILSAFRKTDAPELLLTAVDLPYGDPTLALRLREMRADADVCVLRRGPKGVEPLFALYGRSCADVAEDCLRNGRKSLFALYDRVKVRYVAPEELPEFDLAHIFTNVNTPQDYQMLK